VKHVKRVKCTKLKNVNTEKILRIENNISVMKQNVMIVVKKVKLFVEKKNGLQMMNLIFHNLKIGVKLVVIKE
jgi:hypothetical protein